MIPQPIDTVPLFQRLTEEERQLVTARLKRRQVENNQVVFSEGQTANTLFVITAGWVKLESGSAANSITMANLGAGSLVGEVDMLQSRPYSMTARSAASTQLLTLSRADLEDLVNERPSIGLKFSASIGLRIPFLEKYLVQQRLRHIELLSALSESDLQAIARRLDFRHVERGEIVMETGAEGDAAFIIEEGSVRLIAKTNDGESFEDLKEGAIFGHTALLTNKPHAATGRAIGEVTLWVLPRAAYRELIQQHPTVKLALSRSLAEALSASDQPVAVERMSKLHLFNDVPADALAVLAARLVLRHFPSNEAVYTEGTPGDALYIVESGQVRLMDSAFADAHLLERIRPGEAFGEMALLTGRTRAECARATSDTTLWVLYKNDFDDMLVQYPEVSISLSRALGEKLTARQNDFIIRHMRRMKIFADLAGSELDAISKRVRGLRFRPGEIICFAGQPAITLYLIEKGEIKRMTTGSTGEPHTVDILDAGDSFGDQEIVQNSAYALTAQAMTETELWTITKADFMAMLQEYPALALTVTRLMAERLSRASALPPMQPRPGTGVPPRPTATRPSANMPPPRLQRQPSGARPIKPAASVAPQPKPATNAQKPAVVLPAVASSTSAPQKPAAPASSVKPHLPHFQAPKLPHVQPPHLQAPHFQAPKLPHVQPPHVPNVGKESKRFMEEFGAWAHGLSMGAKLRVLTLSLLAVWFFLIVGPWTTITTVNSAVAGLQLSNNAGTTTVNRASVADANPFGNQKPKVAEAVATSTRVPTRTPLPTFTPQPTAKPTLKPVTRTPAPPQQAAAAAAAPTACAASLAPLSWDPRIGSGPQHLERLENVRLIAASVGRCQKYWRVTVVKFENIDESGNDHTIYVKIQDANGKRIDGVKLAVTSDTSGELFADQPTEKSASDMCDCNYNYPMYGDGYNVQITDGTPSDKVAGMIMPLRRHVNYKITFQLVTNP